MHLLSRRESLLTSPVNNKAIECDLKYLLSVTTGYGSGAECCHKSHDTKDVNPTHLAPQPKQRNIDEHQHNFCSCDCERYGYRRCVRLCERKACENVRNIARNKH
jgi:hypothetical protein